MTAAICCFQVAVIPARYDFTVQRRADYEFDADFEDSSGNPMNLNGWQVLSQVWDPDRTQKYGDMVITIVNAGLGKVRFKIPFSVTSVLPYNSRYDVMLVSPSALREYYLEGLIFASEGYTSLP